MSGIKQIKKKLRKKKQKEAEEKMSETLGLFGKLPDHCLACKLPYNKKSKKAALHWRVTVDSKEEVVKLYCPQCWAIAQQMIEELT
tara:strand:+ start:110 stop:367 length:258 start_codon:yes stop_codon:yes gene_type:complete